MDRFNLETLNSIGPLTFQPALYALVRELRPEIVVETGVHNGVSTACILAALEENELGRLYSCDPRWPSPGQALEYLQPLHPKSIDWSRWTFSGRKSIDALPKFPPLWDLFVHDSDHRAAVMTWELEFALSRLRPGGVLICDDWDASEAEGAFRRFAQKHNLAQSVRFESTAAIISLPSP